MTIIWKVLLSNRKSKYENSLMNCEYMEKNKHTVLNDINWIFFYQEGFSLNSFVNTAPDNVSTDWLSSLPLIHVYSCCYDIYKLFLRTPVFLIGLILFPILFILFLVIPLRVQNKKAWTLPLKLSLIEFDCCLRGYISATTQSIIITIFPY